MDPRSADRQEISQWYNRQVSEHPRGAKAAGWNRQASQFKRFEALCGLGSFCGQRLLDAGCGVGELLSFLRARDIEPVYTGVDLCPQMIARCRQRFEHAATPHRFESADLLEWEPRSSFEFVVASGIFGLDSTAAESRIEPTLARLFSWCMTGLAVNFLSKRAPKKADGRLYVDPGKLLDFALTLTPRARLCHDYLPNDFTVYLFKA